MNQKIAVIYTGKYGSTKRYADWIHKETGADLFEGGSCKLQELSDYDCLVFGGAIHSGGILGIKFLQKNYKKLEGKKILAFAVGLNVDDPQVQEQCREINFAKKLSDVPCFFFRGAYNPAVISGMDKKMMGVVKKMLSGKAENARTAEERELLAAIEEGADYVSYEYVKPLIEELKAL